MLCNSSTTSYAMVCSQYLLHAYLMVAVCKVLVTLVAAMPAMTNTGSIKQVLLKLSSTAR